MSRVGLVAPLVVLTLATGALPARAAPVVGAEARAFPTTIALPNGFRPEGIAIGRAPYAFVGSLADGDVYRADLRTGRGSVISQGPGTPTVGIKVDRAGRLFAAGGSGGDARVIDTRTGRVIAGYRLATGTTFVNDVVLTRDAAWFTDSAAPQPVLYQLRLGRHGRLPAAARRLPLKGDLVYNPNGPNANGIVQTPDRRGLLIVQSNSGKLFRVDPRTGVTRTVDLGGEALPNGDGMLLQGNTLYVVQNRTNAVAVLKVNDAGTSARVIRRITDPRFDVPTTVAAYKGRLYLPNARFTTAPTPTTPYNVVAVTPHRH
ncbi:SMP-30/gluconolactonase/LRE family protein [Actinomadura kijaniata]|uniref:SMP-30/gluconolactonase/LRE family protein n=1 Tax=Actinomadura kijaniata TaxID=46161 RepID=UPI00082D476D|nr:superoxide dismutase [Actinomadura kijaniata]